MQGRIQEISGSILRENNAWSMHIPLHMNQISRSPLMDQKLMQKKKKKNPKISS